MSPVQTALPGMDAIVQPTGQPTGQSFGQPTGQPAAQPIPITVATTAIVPEYPSITAPYQVPPHLQHVSRAPNQNGTVLRLASYWLHLPEGVEPGTQEALCAWQDMARAVNVALSVRVFNKSDPKTKPAKVLLSTFDPDTLAPGAVYRVQLAGDKGEWGPSVTIDRTVNGMSGGATPTQGAMTMHAGADTIMQLLMQQMQATQAQNTALLSKIIDAKAGSGGGGVSELVTALKDVQSIVQRERGAVPLPDGSTPSGGLLSSLEEVAKVKSVLDTIAGGKPARAVSAIKPNPWADALSGLVDQLPTIVGTIVAAVRAVPPPPASQGQTVPTPPPVVTEPSERTAAVRVPNENKPAVATQTPSEPATQAPARGQVLAKHVADTLRANMPGADVPGVVFDVLGELWALIEAGWYEDQAAALVFAQMTKRRDELPALAEACEAMQDAGVRTMFATMLTAAGAPAPRIVEAVAAFEEIAFPALVAKREKQADSSEAETPSDPPADEDNDDENEDDEDGDK